MRQAVWSPLFVEGGWGPGRGSYLPMATHSGASRGRGAVGMFPLLQADSQANYPCNSDRKASVLVHILSLPPLLYRTNYLLWTTWTGSSLSSWLHLILRMSMIPSVLVTLACLLSLEYTNAGAHPMAFALHSACIYPDLSVFLLCIIQVLPKCHFFRESFPNHPRKSHPLYPISTPTNHHSHSHYFFFS